MTTEKENEAIPLTTVEGEEAIPRTIVCGTEKFPKINRINRGEGVEPDRAVNF